MISWVVAILNRGLIGSSLILGLVSACSSSTPTPTPSAITQDLNQDLNAPATPIPSPLPTPTVTPVSTPVPTAVPSSVPTPIPSPSPTPTPIPSPSPQRLPSNASFVEQVIALTNAERQQAGLAPLQADPALTSAAQVHANDMATHDYFDHTSLDGSTLADRVSRTGYPWATLGENIAWGRPDPASVVEGWMNSSGHRANILNESFTEIGVGYTSTGPYWVQVFARPR